MRREQVNFGVHKAAPRDWNRRGHGTEGEASMQRESTPYGFCECGCGERTKLAQKNDRSVGWVRGRPMRFIRGHQARLSRTPESVSISVDENGCWLWQRSTDNDGYAQVSHKGRMTVAHRVYYERHKGPIPQGMEIDHLCRVRCCVNPDHLEAVSRSENIRRGSRTKLTVEQAREIKHSAETPKQLSARFAISPAVIWSIRNGRTWKDA